MSITKWYEACCDNCGAVINHYIHYKLTIKELKKDCGRVVIRNGTVITICDECKKKIKGICALRTHVSDFSAFYH